MESTFQPKHRHLWPVLTQTFNLWALSVAINKIKSSW